MPLACEKSGFACRLPTGLLQYCLAQGVQARTRLGGHMDRLSLSSGLRSRHEIDFVDHGDASRAFWQVALGRLPPAGLDHNQHHICLTHLAPCTLHAKALDLIAGIM